MKFDPFHCLLCLLLFLGAGLARGEALDLFIVAGQSNAQGWKGNAEKYPADPDGIDATIPLFYVSPGIGSSKGKWTTLQAQQGRFPKGHFGLEVTLARALKQDGLKPAVFKYSLGSTSIANNWRQPGNGGLWDRMVADLTKAVALQKASGKTVRFRGFIWIQGESDAKTSALSTAYQERLAALLKHLRSDAVTGTPDLPIILGVDEQHPWVQKHPQVVEGQKKLAAADKRITHTSMKGLEKADSTHLTPAGLEKHGLRIFKAWESTAGAPAKP